MTSAVVKKLHIKTHVKKSLGKIWNWNNPTLEEIMDQLTLFIAIFATLAVLLAGLLFLKSQTSSSGSETKTGARRRAAVPNRDEDGQIVNAGPGPRGRRGAGPRMHRRRWGFFLREMKVCINEFYKLSSIFQTSRWWTWRYSWWATRSSRWFWRWWDKTGCKRSSWKDWQKENGKTRGKGWKETNAGVRITSKFFRENN